LGEYRRNIERKHLIMELKPHVTQTNTLFYIQHSNYQLTHTTLKNVVTKKF